DIKYLQEDFLDRNYAKDFLELAEKCMINKKKLELKKVKRIKSTNDYLEYGRKLYEELKKKPILKKIMQNEKIFNYAKNKYNSKKQKNEKVKFNNIKPSSDRKSTRLNSSHVS